MAGKVKITAGHATPRVLVGASSPVTAVRHLETVLWWRRDQLTPIQVEAARLPLNKNIIKHTALFPERPHPPVLTWVPGCFCYH